MKHDMYKLGSCISLLTVILTVVTFSIAIFTPPFSGPYCRSNCFQYPFLDITSRFPRDYIWMYPAVFLALSYFVLMVCFHYYASLEKKIYSHIGVSFALMSTLTFIVDYFLQLSVIQSSLINGETKGIALLTQFNPHGIFIALEEVGFLLMALSFLFISQIFNSKHTIERGIKWLLRVSFVLTALSFIYYSLQYGISREYRFEVMTISINWLTLIILGILSFVLFKRSHKEHSRLTTRGNQKEAFRPLNGY